jgi:hypothetical protein
LGSGWKHILDFGREEPVGEQMWNADEHSNDENLRWCHLRAIEWAAMPAFLSQLFAPALFIVVSWKLVFAGIIGTQLLWSFVRYKFVSPRFAYVSASIVIICKWLVAAPVAVFLFAHSQIFTGVLALTWPFVVGVLGAFPPVMVGRLQSLFMEQLGHVPHSQSSTI